MVSPMTSENRKRKIYFDLWDAFSRGGCPICNVVAGKTIETIRDSDEPALRETLRTLCAEHVRFFAKSIAEGNDRMLLNLMQEAGVRIQDTLASYEKRSPLRDFLAKLCPSKANAPLRESSRRCIACRINRQHERMSVKIFLGSLTDPDFDRSFQESDGLCFYHNMQLARDFPGDPKTPVVLKSQLRRLHDLKDAFSMLYTGEKHNMSSDDREITEHARLFLTGRVEMYERASEPSSDDDGDVLFPISEKISEDGHMTTRADLSDATFEKEKLQRAMIFLRNQLHDESSRAAALHFRYWQAEENNKILQMNLTGTKAQIRLLEEHIQLLKEEISRYRLQKGAACGDDEDR